jgi:hypothetical protein
MGARNRVGIGLLYRPAKLHGLSEFIPWNLFLGSINVYKYGLWTVSGYALYRARICRSFKETRYRFSAWRAGTKPYLSYWTARLHRLAKSIPRNRFLGSINVYKYGL